MPLQFKILLLGLNAPNRAPLDLAAEFDDIADVLTQVDARYSIQFDLNPRRKASLDDLQGLLTSYRPQMLHFSGHGGEGGISIGGQLADPRRLGDIIGKAGVELRCVVLNVCDGESFAESLLAHVDVVVSMRNTIEDLDAKRFAKHFYIALREGKSVGASFDIASAQLHVLEAGSADAPKIHVRPELDASQLFVKDFAVDESRIEQRRMWLECMADTYTQLRPADPLLRRIGDQRYLHEILLPLDLIEGDRSGQLGITRRSIIEIWDQSNEPLLVTGEIGAGKSTALTSLGYELANRTRANETDPVPKLISALFLASKRKQLAEPLRLCDIAPSVSPDAPADAHKLYLLVDGFDELTRSLWQHGERCIRELMKSKFIARIVVSSRPHSSLPYELFRQYRIMPWPKQRAREFAGRWSLEAVKGIDNLATGNPLTLTLACAYANRAHGGLLGLLERVVVDIRREWQRMREVDPSAPFFDDREVEDCCLWLLLGPDEKDPTQFPRRRFDPVLEFLEREGLACAGDDPFVPAGARWVVEYLAARACVRRGYDLEQPGGRLELAELTKVGLALELKLEPERALTRFDRIFCLDYGRHAFRLRLSTITARACALHGSSLPRSLTYAAVEYLWRNVIDDCSMWKSAQAAEALATLCEANPAAADIVRGRVEHVIDCGNDDATELLAARDGLMHVSSRVRARTLEKLDCSSLLDIGAILHQQMFDHGLWGHGNVAVAAGKVFRKLPRTPALEPWVRCLTTHLRSGNQSLSAAAAAGLMPGEASLEDLGIGMGHLMDLGECSEDIRQEFIDFPGGLEAAKDVRSSMIINGVSPSLADGPSTIRPQIPVPLYSHFVQRSCWQWLVSTLQDDDSRLGEIARRQAVSHNLAAFTAVIAFAQRRPDILSGVFEEAPPWSLIVEHAANEPLRELLLRDDSVREAFCGYLQRGIEANHTGHVRIVEMLEPLLDRDRERDMFVRLLGLAWSAPAHSYRLPPALIERPEVAAAARRYVESLLDQVEGQHEFAGRPLFPPAAAEPLLGAAWFQWEEMDVIRARLETWLKRGSTYAQLVASMLRDMPEPILEAVRPALDAYLARPITGDAYQDADARRVVFLTLPHTKFAQEDVARFEQHALAHAGVRTSGSLAAIAALCRVVSPERGRELSRQAVRLRLDMCGFPDDDLQQHLLVLLPLAPDEWLQVALAHPLGLCRAAPIFEALFATSNAIMRNIFAHLIWKWLREYWTPYCSVHSKDIVGCRPSDLAQEWLYRYADAQVGRSEPPTSGSASDPAPW